MYRTPFGMSQVSAPGAFESYLMNRGSGGGDTGISAYNNALASIVGSLFGSRSQDRATDAGLLGQGHTNQANLLGSIFGNQTGLQASQFGDLASLLGNMYGSKSGALSSLGQSAAGRDASMYQSQAGLLGQGLGSQADVIGSLSGLQGQLANVYGGLDAQRMNNEHQLGMFQAASPLLASLFGRGSQLRGAGLPSFTSNYGASARWS